MKTSFWRRETFSRQQYRIADPVSPTPTDRLLTGDSSATHLKTVLTYLIELRTRWERGESVSLAMLLGVYTDQVFKSMLLTCEDADAHLFSAPLHSLIAYCEQQLAEN